MIVTFEHLKSEAISFFDLVALLSLERDRGIPFNDYIHDLFVFCPKNHSFYNVLFNLLRLNYSKGKWCHVTNHYTFVVVTFLNVMIRYNIC